MEPSWTNIDYYLDSNNDDNYNDCGVCHGEDQKSPLNPSLRIHDPIKALPCSQCHRTHCAMDIIPGWTGAGSCENCHPNGDRQLPNGQLLHDNIPFGVSCSECHQDHRGAASLLSYLLESQKCRYCHGDQPPINVRSQGVESPGLHLRELTDCQACHPGVTSSGRHYLHPGPPKVIQKGE